MTAPMEFVTAVRDMRLSQKEYFRTRNTRVLEESKQREKVVDDMLLDILNPPTGEQQALFL